MARAFTNLTEILEVFNLCIASYKRLDNLLKLTLEDENSKNKEIVIEDKDQLEKELNEVFLKLAKMK